jgi:pimeloyl-ACP methyl ester carboxylesterase
MSPGKLDETAYQLQGSGPTVTLIHGLGLNRAMWQWQLPALIPHFEVLTYDLLGHGNSANPSGVPDLVMFSEQLLRLLDGCRMERVAVVGFSLGGMIARRFALDHPDRLSALAILHSAHDRTPVEREAVLERVRQVQVSGPSSTVNAALERWFTTGFRTANPDLMALVRGWILANDPALYPGIYRVLAEGDAEIARGIGGISCPTLVMTGEEDAGNSPEMANKMAALIPGARTVILPGLRHMALAEAPQAVNEPLVSFLLNAHVAIS